MQACIYDVSGRLFPLTPPLTLVRARYEDIDVCLRGPSYLAPIRDFIAPICIPADFHRSFPGIQGPYLLTANKTFTLHLCRQDSNKKIKGRQTTFVLRQRFFVIGE